MISLCVQMLEIRDCEAEVERAYFEWGRESGPTSSDPAWEACSTEERHRIALRGYRLYDGWPALGGNDLGALEAYVSVGVNSRVILYDVVRILARADEARPLLAAIPDGARLEESTDGQIAAAAQLIDLLAGAFQISWGKATKVLHKKRPSFIPVLDSVAFDFLWKNFPHRLTQGTSAVDMLHLYRELLLARARPLEGTRAALADRGFHLSTARLLDFLIWIGWQKQAFRPLREVWAAESLSEARVKAHRSWAAAGP